MIRLSTVIMLLLLSAQSRAQYIFAGHIAYERRVNLNQLWDGDEWMERMKDKAHPFYISYFSLAFNENESRYAPAEGRESVTSSKATWGMPPGADNEVLREYRTGILTAKKSIYDEPFLVRDSVQRHTWLLGNEIRTIAGYKCRKAVTRICDSVVVVAFYTDEIPVSGGPEQMGGLPGMILELAVPRLYTTWTATKVETGAVKDSELAAPVKGKPMTLQQLTAKLEESLKDWGKRAQRNIWWTVL